MLLFLFVNASFVLASDFIQPPYEIRQQFFSQHREEYGKIADYYYNLYTELYNLQYSKDDASTRYIGDPEIITARSDGTKITFRAVHPRAMNMGLPDKYSLDGRRAINNIFTFECFNKDDSLLFNMRMPVDYFHIPNDSIYYTQGGEMYFRKLEIHKYADLSNMTIYKLLYGPYPFENYMFPLYARHPENPFKNNPSIYTESIVQRVKVILFWIDKTGEYKNYNGYFTDTNLTYEIRTTKSVEGERYYNYITDAYRYIINDYKWFSVDDNINKALQFLILYNDEEGIKLQKEIEALKELNFEKMLSRKRYDMTRQYILRCILPVSESYGGIYIKIIDPPEINGDLPRTEEDLKLFLEWKSNLDRRWHDYPFRNEETYGALKDYYGMPITFELVPEGLKASSAGPDKTFGTADDIVIMRIIHEEGSYPWMISKEIVDMNDNK